MVRRIGTFLLSRAVFSSIARIDAIKSLQQAVFSLDGSSYLCAAPTGFALQGCELHWPHVFGKCYE